MKKYERQKEDNKLNDLNCIHCGSRSWDTWNCDCDYEKPDYNDYDYDYDCNCRFCRTVQSNWKKKDRRDKIIDDLFYENEVFLPLKELFK